MTRAHTFVAVMAALVAPWAPAAAQQEPPAPSGPAAFLFVYRLKPGVGEDLFDQAYRRHLEWHRTHGDRLPWFAWYITGGPRVGLFVNGTFGVPFQALDQRVSPSEDAADLDQTAGAFADPVDRNVYRLRRDLSTATPLEARAPDASVDVLEVVVAPGGARAFEDALARAQRAWAQRDDRPSYTCYELVAGGELSSYLIMIGRRGWELYDRVPGSGLDLVFGSSLEVSRRELEGLQGRVVRVRSETWTYRPDLTLLPPDPSGGRRWTRPPR